MIEPEKMIEIGQQILDSQPFSVWLGAKCTHMTANEVELALVVRPEFLQQFGFVHGGVLSYLADNALTFAGGLVLGLSIVTSEYKINYLRPAKGNQLVARAMVVHGGQRQAVCRCDVYSVDGNGEVLCATAQGTIARLEKEYGTRG